MNGSGIVAVTHGGFIAGLLIGIFLGLLLGPILRSWLAWREWVHASRQADLTERFLARWEQEGARSDAGTSAGEQPPAGRGTSPPQSAEPRSARSPAKRDGESSVA